MISEKMKTDIGDLRDDSDKIKSFLSVVESYPPEGRKQVRYIIGTLVALHDSLGADIAYLEFCVNNNDQQKSSGD